MVKALVFVIRLYQRFISPLTPRVCRFYPTCSEYAVQSLYKHGLAKGSFKALIRIAKCHPLHPGGYDPV
ncbi:MAG: membrane protein insertion efficiency factor YidD [Clostridia bacterium]|nr:membrane protein insertion efficiency factor YidD [Clostridia bacterium]